MGDKFNVNCQHRGRALAAPALLLRQAQALLQPASLASRIGQFLALLNEVMGFTVLFSLGGAPKKRRQSVTKEWQNRTNSDEA